MIQTPYTLSPIRKMPPADASPDLLLYIARWQHNSPTDFGFLRFCFEVFPHIAIPRFKTPRWVIPALQDILKWEKGYTKIDKQHAICTHRDGAKTTYVKLLILYFILVGQYGIYWEDVLLPEFDLIRIRGKNFEESERRAFDIRVEVKTERIKSLFGDLNPSYQEVRNEGLKTNIKIMIFKNKYILVPLGLNQPSRGFNIMNRRPKLDIDDDVENKENTKTPMSREYTENEILGEQLGGLDTEGMTIYIFNMVHPQCLGKKLQDSGAWKVIPAPFRQFSYFDEEGNEYSSWEERFPLSYIKKLEDFYKKHNKWKIFRLEYYNEIVGEGEYKAIYFNGKYEHKEDMNFVVVRAPEGGTEQWHRAYIVVSGDPAISDDKKASIPAIGVIAFCADRKRRIIDIRMNRYDIVDRYYDNKEPSNRILALDSDDLAKVKKRGMVSEMARLIVRYNADMFVLERAGQQTAWYNDLIDILNKLYNVGILRKKPTATTYVPKDNKVIKLTENLMNHVSANAYEIIANVPHRQVLDNAITAFPGGNLDILDILHNAERMAFNKIPDSMIKTAFNTFKPSEKSLEIKHPYVRLLQLNPDLDLYDIMP